MTILEAILLKLTRDTSSGGSCRIGEAAIVVRYCSDIWEWEYRGETYWDLRDLAEAMILDGTFLPERVPQASNPLTSGFALCAASREMALPNPRTPEAHEPGLMEV